MSRIAAAVLAVAIGSTTSVHADGGRFGLGLVVGKPSGLTGEYRLSNRTALAGVIGLDLFDDGRRFYGHLDFLFALPDLLTGGAVGLSPYLGPGVFIQDLGKQGDRLGLGLRGSFGLSLDFRRAPIQLFAELALLMPLAPDLDFAVGGAAGFRYYF